MTDFKIRPMRAADMKTVTRMIRELTVFFGDKSQIKERDLRLHVLGKDKPNHILLVWHKDKPAGFCLSSDWFNFTRGFTVRNIHLLFIQEKYRRQGLGTALIKASAQAARKAGCHRVDIQAARQNKAAHKAYKALGFTVRSDHPVHYRMPLKK